MDRSGHAMGRPQVKHHPVLEVGIPVPQRVLFRVAHQEQTAIAHHGVAIQPGIERERVAGFIRIAGISARDEYPVLRRHPFHDQPGGHLKQTSENVDDSLPLEQHIIRYRRLFLHLGISGARAVPRCLAGRRRSAGGSIDGSSDLDRRRAKCQQRPAVSTVGPPPVRSNLPRKFLSAAPPADLYCGGRRPVRRPGRRGFRIAI